jgi:hypothetical protein
MYPRRDARTDPNQPEIVRALRQLGALVYYIRWPFDLLVVFRGELQLLEVKGPKGQLTGSQKDTIHEMAVQGGYWPRVVRSVEEALEAVGKMGLDSPTRKS